MASSLIFQRSDRGVAVFHSSIRCNYAQNKHILNSGWMTFSCNQGWGGWACLFAHLHMSVCRQLFINQLDTLNKTCPGQGNTDECRSDTIRAPLQLNPLLSQKVRHLQYIYTSRLISEVILFPGEKFLFSFLSQKKFLVITPELSCSPSTKHSGGCGSGGRAGHPLIGRSTVYKSMCPWARCLTPNCSRWLFHRCLNV